MSYIKRRNAENRAASKSTEAQRHLRNARKARIQQAQAYLEAAIEAGADKMNEAANARIAWAKNTLDEAEQVCDLTVSQED